MVSIGGRKLAKSLMKEKIKMSSMHSQFRVWNTPLIYIVEREPWREVLISRYLTSSGYEKRCFFSSSSAIDAAADISPSLFILDVPLDPDTVELIRRIRSTESLSTVGIILLLQRESEAAFLRSSHVGVDDHLVRPFTRRALLAKVQRNLPIRTEPRVCKTMMLGHLEIDPSAMVLKVGGSSVRTTKLQFSLLDYLASNAPRIVSRDELIHVVWRSQLTSRQAVKNCVNDLRKIIEPDPRHPSYLKSVRGLGYRFDCPTTAANFERANSANASVVRQPEKRMGKDFNSLPDSVTKPDSNL
jgi:DNA-binding response OmpR family regulator